MLHQVSDAVFQQAYSDAVHVQPDAVWVADQQDLMLSLDETVQSLRARLFSAFEAPLPEPVLHIAELDTALQQLDARPSVQPTYQPVADARPQQQSEPSSRPPPAKQKGTQRQALECSAHACMQHMTV